MNEKNQSDQSDNDNQPDPRPDQKKRPNKKPGSFNQKSRNIKKQQIRRPQHF